MRKWVVVLLVFVMFSSVFGVLYFRYGVDSYLSSMGKIRRLSPELQAKAEAEFVSDSSIARYNGSLMKVSDNYIWIWGRSGPKRYKLDEETIYFYYSMCDKQLLADLEEGKPVDPIQKLTGEIEKWREYPKAGDYIVLTETVEGQGGTVGNARDVRVYDWWPMIPSSLEELCGN